MGDQPGWCVVISKPMAEEIAERNIRKAGYRVYLPRYRKVLRRTATDAMGRKVREGKGEIVMRPLFTGYLFAELHPGQGWRAIRTIGVADHDGFLIMRGDAPALLPDALIEELRARERAGSFDDPRLHKKKPGRQSFNDGELALRPQAEVRVEAGPFAGFIGQITDVDDAGRGSVLLSIFGRQSPTWLPLDDLTPLAAE